MKLVLVCVVLFAVPLLIPGAAELYSQVLSSAWEIGRWLVIPGALVVLFLLTILHVSFLRSSYSEAREVGYNLAVDSGDWEGFDCSKASLLTNPGADAGRTARGYLGVRRFTKALDSGAERHLGKRADGQTGRREKPRTHSS